MSVSSAVVILQSCVDTEDILSDRVLYTPERLIKIANEAVKENSPFSLEDRIGLVYDTFALAKAGYLNISSVLSLYDTLRNEKECTCFRLQVNTRRAD